MPKPTVPQAQVLTIASEGAIFRGPPVGGDWLYSFPGMPLRRSASGVTCRSLVKHGWLQRIHVDSDPHGFLYVISAEGRLVLDVSGLKQAAQPTEAAPANIKF